MASARNEAPRESSVGRGVPFPLEEGLGGGYAPFPDFFLIFELKMASFGAFWELILLQLNSMAYTHKPVSLDFSL